MWITDSSGDTQSVYVEAQPFGVELESGERFGIELIAQREVLDAPFAIQPNVTIPSGDYRFERWRAELATSDKRPLSSRLSFEAGTFFDGDSDVALASLEWRQSRYFLLDSEFERDDVRLPGGDFVVNIARLRAVALTSPDVSWSNFVQWDDESDALSLNSRLWWILAPGSEAFFVVNQGWQHASPHFAASTTDVALKFGYTFRF